MNNYQNLTQALKGRIATFEVSNTKTKGTFSGQLVGESRNYIRFADMNANGRIQKRAKSSLVRVQSGSTVL